MCGSILKRNTFVYRKNTTEEDVASVELLDIIQNTDNNNELLMYSELFIDNNEKESILHLICVSLGLSVFFIIIFNIIKHL
jgi:hypothetical protein